MSRHRLRVQADAYGVHLEIDVEHAGTATCEELERALRIASDKALAEHAARQVPPC